MSAQVTAGLPSTPEALLSDTLDRIRETDEWSPELDGLAQVLASTAPAGDVFRLHRAAVKRVTHVYRHYWPPDALSALQPLADDLRERIG